jgi:hypothetical protein
MKFRVFAFALALGATARAATYAYFGNSLMAGELKLVVVATGVILGLLALPLAFPAGRAFFKRVLLGQPETAPETAEATPLVPAEDSTQTLL